MSHKKPDILFIDDELHWCRVMKELADFMGFNVFTTTSPRHGLRKFLRGHFDLVITDIRMPDESGFSFIRRIRKHDSEIPIIIVTGFHTNKVHRLAETLNVQKVLIKPFRVSDLEEAISELLGM